ncbi:MAG: nucleotidyltransferase domain-containing protein, partial [Polaribacter sp.]
MINTKLVNNVTGFITTYYENQYSCLISGSYADGRNNEYSDVDVLVFTKDRNTVFNETLSYNKLKIQSIIIPVQNVQEILWVDYITCKGAIINMISKGYILFDSADYLKNLISHAQELEKLGGRPLTDNEVYMGRVRITSQLFDIMGGNDIH